MACGLVHASYSLPEWQAVKLAFLHPVFVVLICFQSTKYSPQDIKKNCWSCKTPKNNS